MSVEAHHVCGLRWEKSFSSIGFPVALAIGLLKLDRQSLVGREAPRPECCMPSIAHLELIQPTLAERAMQEVGVTCFTWNTLSSSSRFPSVSTSTWDSFLLRYLLPIRVPHSCPQISLSGSPVWKALHPRSSIAGGTARVQCIGPVERYRLRWE